MSFPTGAMQQLRDFIEAAGQRPILKKPRDLTYGVDDTPPLYVVLLGGLQHVGLVTIFLIYPLLIIRELGVSVALSANLRRSGYSSLPAVEQ
jgi:hypothetical protein